MASPLSFTFGRFTLDLSRRRLFCAGDPVALSSRGLDILAVLIEARDRVVSRTELMAAVWPGLTVEEHNLSVQISKLRRALDDPGDSVIATVPGRGYRFVAPVEPDLVETQARAIEAPGPPASRSAASPPPLPPPRLPARRRDGMIGLGILGLAAALAAAGAAWLLSPAAPPRLSIVVMPFRDLSDPPGQQFVADAITDDLTTDLAHLPGATVVARETAEAYAARHLSASEIGRALDVRYLLEGSERTEDATIHVNAQLIGTARGLHLWSERFDTSRAGLAEAREEIVGHLAGALDVALGEAEAARAERERPDDPDATDLFLRARSRLDHDETLAGYEAAQGLLNRALTLRPDFVEARAALAHTLLLKIRETDDPEDQADLAAARGAVSTALRAAPDRSDVLTAAAELAFADGRLADAAADARLVLGRDASDVGARDVLATCAIAQARLPEAAAELQTTLRLDPEGRLTRLRAFRLASVLLLQGLPGQAEEWARRATAGQPEPAPGAPEWGVPEEARLVLMGALDLQGRVGEARALYRQYASVWPHRTAWRIAALWTRAASVLPGFRRMIASLEDAGMPSHADEHADDGVHPGSLLPDQDFAATPTTLPGGRVIDTAALAGQLRHHPPDLIVDFGRGAAVIAGAVWKGDDPAEDDDQFIRRVFGAGSRFGPRSSIVVMADGVYGAVGSNQALALIGRGFRNVAWYRGGEEAWAAAGLPSRDLRQ